jgi:anti-sigma B factor antagonist
MADDLFEAKIRNVAGAVVIDLTGEINGQAERGLIDVYSSAENKNPGSIVLNFSKVSYINSTGIALIVNILARSRKKNLELRVFGLSQHYQEIFNITRLTDYLKVYPDEVSAVNVG